MSRPRTPLFAFAMAILAVAMLGPSLLALLQTDWHSARSFLYAAIFTGFSAGILGVALAGSGRLPEAQSELLTLLACWTILPVFAAIPLALITPRIGAVGAWFEMTAAFTTTGGTIYQTPADVPDAVHLWRGLVGWLGGLMTLTAAYAILAPRRMGGFEVSSSAHEQGGQSEARLVELGAATAPIGDRIHRALRTIFPVYLGLTLVTTLLFNALGKGPLISSVHAMSIVSTSGISPLGTGLAGEESVLVEIVAAVVLVLAATRLIYARASQIGTRVRWRRDAELGLMGALVLTATLALFARHWLGALTVDITETPLEAAKAFWGAAFTSLSFLTTTGFESGFWASARDWSGLANPGLVLLGLCAIGGGAATTAGGIKLIRAFALLRHGMREVERIAQPMAVVGVGSGMRSILRAGAFVAWAFIMLYVLVIFSTTIALTVTGLEFQSSLIGAISAVSNTGPAFDFVLDTYDSFALLTTPQRAILAAGMILGRIEALAVIAIFSPDAWRALASSRKNSGNALHKRPDSRW